MSDDSDDTSFPAVHTGPTGRVPDAPSEVPGFVTDRPRLQMYQPPAVQTPPSANGPPAPWKTLLTPWTWGEDTSMTHRVPDNQHQQAPPAYPEDMYVREEEPETVTISGGQAYYDAYTPSPTKVPTLCQQC